MLYGRWVPIGSVTSRCIGMRTRESSRNLAYGCLGYPWASTVISRLLDSIMLPWLAIPATQPWAPHPVLQAPVMHWVNSGDGEGRGGGGGRKMLMNRPKQLFQGPPYWNTLVQWRRALSIQYHMNTPDWKYQLLFVVNFVKLHLTAFICFTMWSLVIQIVMPSSNYDVDWLHGKVANYKKSFSTDRKILLRWQWKLLVRKFVSHLITDLVEWINTGETHSSSLCVVTKMNYMSGSFRYPTLPHNTSETNS